MSAALLRPGERVVVVATEGGLEARYRGVVEAADSVGVRLLAEETWSDPAVREVGDPEWTPLGLVVVVLWRDVMRVSLPAAA